MFVILITEVLHCFIQYFYAQLHFILIPSKGTKRHHKEGIKNYMNYSIIAVDFNDVSSQLIKHGIGVSRVENKDVVGAAPTGDSPTTSELSANVMAT